MPIEPALLALWCCAVAARRTVWWDRLVDRDCAWLDCHFGCDVRHREIAEACGHCTLAIHCGLALLLVL